MRSLLRQAMLVALLLATLLSSTMSAQTDQKQGTGVITGRVTSNDKGMANVTVVLYGSDIRSTRTSTARATTDADGHYKLMNVPTGRYTVAVVAPTMTGPPDGTFGELGKTVTIADGETVEKIDFTLIRGGVITGRITDADGAPVVGETVNLSQPGNQRVGRYSFNSNPYMYQTDDRGIYRLYGIPPGKYTVSVGEASEEGSARFGFSGRGYYRRTFYPSVTDESKATAIEVSEGSEASGIDITLGRKEKYFVATGRLVDESGQPVANTRIGYGSLLQDNRMGGYGWGSVSDAQGRFRLDSLMPGRYAAFVWNDGNSDAYSDSVPFQISEGDISGLELKLRRGSSISGVAVVEGTTDRSVLAKLSQLYVGAFTTRESQGMSPSMPARTRLAADGTFTLMGLRPGKFMLSLSTFPPLPGFTLSRVERDGVAQKEIEITQGQQVTGVRVVITYGSGSIRGLVKFEGETLSDNMRMMVGAVPLTHGTSLQIRPVQVDSRGRFLIEGLPTGDYELTLQTFIVGSGGPPRRFPPIKQRVSVTNGAESEVTLTFDPNAKQEGGNNE